MPDVHDLEQQLATRLRGIVDDHPVPRPNLSDAISRARRRSLVSKSAVGVVVAAALVTGGALLTDVLTSRYPVTAVPGQSPTTQPTFQPGQIGTPSVAPRDPTPGAAEKREMLRLCQPQFEEVKRFPMYADMDPTRLKPVHNRLYLPGDFIAFQSDSGTGLPAAQVLCQLPVDVGAPVDFRTTEPAALPDAALGSYCMEQGNPSGPFGEDLRGAEVIAKQKADQVVSVLLKREGERYGCTAMPRTWDLLGNVQRAFVREAPASFTVDVALHETGASPKALVGEKALYVTGQGVLPDVGARIIVRLAGQEPVEVPVAPGGGYAIALKYPGLSGQPRVQVDVVDAEGKVLSVS